MLSVPTPTPPPPPPPFRTDAELEIEPDKQWKADLRKRIEHSLREMVEDARTVRDNILSSQPPESRRERAMAQYNKSMNEMRIFAEEEFTRCLRQEMSERKWALNVVDLNSPDVARQQQWILDNIHKAEGQRTPSPLDHNRRAAGALSGNPQQLGDGERVSDGLAESEEEGEDDSDDEAHEEDGSKPRQSRLPSRLNSSLIHPLHSKSPVSRRGPPSPQRHPFNNQPPVRADAKLEIELDEQWKAGLRKGIEHSLREMSESTQTVRDTILSSQQTSRERAMAQYEKSMSEIWTIAQIECTSQLRQEIMEMSKLKWALHSNLSDISRQQQWILDDTHKAEARRTPFPPNRNRRAAGALSSSPQQLGETSASASPHDRPTPPSYPIVSPRPIPGQRPPSHNDTMRFPMSARPSSRTIYGAQRLPEDVRQGIAIPRGPTSPDEGPSAAASWSLSLHSRRPLGDFNAHRRHDSKGDLRQPPVDGDYSDASDYVVGQLDELYSVYSARQAEASAKLREAAAQKKEAEAKKREAEAQEREAQLQHKEEEARLREFAARRREEQARRKEEEAMRKEEEARMREEEVRRMEDEVRKLEDDAIRREEDARKMEEARRFEDEAREMEEEVRRRKEEDKRAEENSEQKRREMEQKKVQLKKWEDELSLLEDAAHRAQEESARRAEETARLQAEAEAARLQAEEIAQATEEVARQAEESAKTDRPAEESAQQIPEPEVAAPEQEKQPEGQGREAKGQTKRQNEKALEEQRQTELEQQHFEEKRLEDEHLRQQEREQQIRLDEELSRNEQERLSHEAMLEQQRLQFEAQEWEADRLREERLHAAEEEQLRHLEEQRRKVADQGLTSHAEQLLNLRQQQQRVKEEQQKEFERRVVQSYQRMLERERQNSIGAAFDSPQLHRPNFHDWLRRQSHQRVFHLQ